MPKTMEQITEAFTGGPNGKVLQECRTLIATLLQEGLNAKDFVAYMADLDVQNRQRTKERIEADKKLQEARAEYAKKARKCKQCKSVMYCYPVNTVPGDQVGGNWKSVWVCGNTDCLHEEYSLNDVETEMLGLNIEY